MANQPQSLIPNLQPPILVCDIDGTLLNPQGQLTVPTRQALQNWVDAGGLLVLATGRNYRASHKFIQAIKRPLYLVLQDGCLLQHYPSGEVLAYHNLPLRVAQRAWHAFRQAQTAMLLFEPLPVGSTFSLCDFGPPSAGLAGYLSHYQGQYQSHPPQAPTIAPSKIVTLDTANKTAELEKALHNLFQAEMGVRILRTEAVRLGVWFLELGSAQASKALTLQVLLARLGLSWANVIAVGDAENDVEMIQLAGLGVAMGNASVRVKAVADRVIGSNEADGLAQFVLMTAGR